MKIAITLVLGIFLSFSAFAAPTTILFLGDSLTEGLGVDEQHAYPRVVEKKLREAGYDVNVINGGVSGATTASGFSRLKWHLKKKIDIVVIELGANDGLRGLKLPQTEENLREMVKLAQSHKIRVMMLGLRMPPNYGKKYTADFEAMYKNIAASMKVPTLNAFLVGVEGVAELNQADGIHPNIKGHEVVASNVFQFIGKSLPKPTKTK
jgi:acyl-CoA thioesterase I